MSAEVAQYTAFDPPPQGWDAPMTRDKQLWLLGLTGSSVVLILITFVWMFIGQQNLPYRQYDAAPADFEAQVNGFIAKLDPKATGIVNVPPGEDAYLLGAMWNFKPVLRLKAGQTYTIWYSSKDVVHNPIIADQRLTFVMVPGHVYGIRLTPKEPGTFLVYCAEYCGLGHQLMATKIIVEK